MNTIPENSLYAYIFASLAHDPSFELLKDRYPDILADLVSAKSNANCSCRGRVVSYINQKYQIDSEKTFLNEIFSNETIKLEAEKQIVETQARIANNFAGKIITVMKKDDYWKDFHLSTLRGSYRAFSVVDKGDSVDVYFL
jgi:hypothetical protein